MPSLISCIPHAVCTSCYRVCRLIRLHNVFLWSSLEKEDYKSKTFVVSWEKEALFTLCWHLWKPWSPINHSVASKKTNGRACRMNMNQGLNTNFKRQLDVNDSLMFCLNLSYCFLWIEQLLFLLSSLIELNTYG